jgi:hypothetical protein
LQAARAERAPLVVDLSATIKDGRQTMNAVARAGEYRSGYAAGRRMTGIVLGSILAMTIATAALFMALTPTVTIACSITTVHGQQYANNCTQVNP